MDIILCPSAMTASLQRRRVRNTSCLELSIRGKCEPVGLDVLFKPRDVGPNIAWSDSRDIERFVEVTAVLEKPHVVNGPARAVSRRGAAHRRIHILRETR